MGLWSTIMGWFSSGVKVLLWKYSEPLSKSNPVVTGSVLVKSSALKTIVSLEVKVIEEHTYTVEDGEEKKKETKTSVLGSVKFPSSNNPGQDFPREVKAGEEFEQAFTVHVAVNDRLRGHATSTAGKMFSFAVGDKTEYFLVAEAGVKGTAFGPSDKKKLPIAE